MVTGNVNVLSPIRGLLGDRLKRYLLILPNIGPAPMNGRFGAIQDLIGR